MDAGRRGAFLVRRRELEQEDLDGGRGPPDLGGGAAGLSSTRRRVRPDDASTDHRTAVPARAARDVHRRGARSARCVGGDVPGDLGARAVTFPHVRVEGGPRDRGRSYGEQVRDRVHRSIEAYEEVFGGYAGWTWNMVTDHARAYEQPIERFEPSYLEEIRGIAEGAGVAAADVLAINVRTEIMFAAKARDATGRAVPECSAFAV